MATATKSNKKTTIQTKNGARKNNFGPVKIGAITYKNKSAAIRHYLKRTKLKKTQIAAKIGVSDALVTIVDHREHIRTPEGRVVGSKKRIQ